MTSRPEHAPQPEARHPRDAALRPASLVGGNEHPLIDIPFSVYVDGRQFAGDGISLVEAQVVGLADPALENQERLVRIAFDFGGFSVSLHPKVRILRDSPQRLVLRFSEPTGDHLPQLRHLLNDHISGDLTSFGSVVRTNGAMGASPAGSRRRRTSAWSVLRRLLGGLVVLALTFLLVGAAVLLVGQRLLVMRLDAPGQVVIDGQTLNAVASGQLSYLDPQAAVGEVVATIAATSGETLSIVMPCDCEAILGDAAEGGTVVAGEPLLTLVEGPARTVVEASVPVRDLFALQQAGGAEIRLADGRATFGALVGGSRAAPGESTALVRLTPAEPLAADLAGQAVELSLHREPRRLLDRLAGLWAPVASAWTGAWTAATQS